MDDCPGHHFHLVFFNGCGVHHSSLFFRRSLTTHNSQPKTNFPFPFISFWFYYFVSVFYPTFLSYFVPPCCCYSQQLSRPSSSYIKIKKYIFFYYHLLIPQVFRIRLPEKQKFLQLFCFIISCVDIIKKD